jgi:hypothetical protein
MKHRIIMPVLLAILTLGVFGAFAQTLEYTFSTTTGTYEAITGGILLGTETSDDQRFVDPTVPEGGTTTTGPGFDLGFNLTFNGAVFDRLAINNNGWISLGQSALTPSVNNASSSAYTPLSSTTAIDPPVLYNRIAALGRDLQAQVGASIRLETIGTAPNRVCVIQWANYKKYGTSGTGDSFNFQIRLYETSNNVKIVYGACTSNATAGNMQVGLRGPDPTDFNARQGDTGWDNTTAATANNQYVVMTDVYYPANGLIFNFNYPVATQPPNPATVVRPLDGAILVPPATTLLWQSGGGLPTGYKLFFGTDNPPTNIANNQDLGMVTSYDPTPDMNLDTTYYWKVVPYNGFGDATGCPVWSFTTHGDPEIDALPYTQNWDLVTPPGLPFDWTSIVQSTSTSAFVGTYASTTYAHSQPNTSRLYNPSDASATLLLVGPPLATTLPVNSVRVKFWARSSGANYPLSLGVITNPTDASTYTEVYNIALTTTLTEYIYDMTTYTGTGVNIAFKHGLGGTGRSLYVDDIAFEQIAPNDLGCDALTGNTTPSVGAATTYNATIHNWGTAAQSTYTVKLFNSDNVELATTAGVTIDPGTTVQIPLAWTPTAEGPAVIYAKVFLTGDINPANDQSPNLNIVVQPAGVVTVTVGDGSLQEGVPLEFYYKNSLFQGLFYQTELNVYGQITALTFYNNFVTDLQNKPCKFWLAQTALEDLSAGWILDGLTLVYDGTANFPTGQNTITIPLQTPFNYTSGNLVLYANRPMDTDYFSSSDNFYAQTIGTNRARKLYSDSTTYDPLAPSAAGTLSGTFPKTSFSFVTGGFAALNGTVTSGGNPVADVDIVINTTTYATTTNVLGQYNFPFVQPGQYTVTASKLGYESQTLPVTLVADQTTTLDFVLATSSSVPVTGFVVGSDQPTVGLAEAEVHLNGVMDYEAVTDATGHFTIPGVLSGNTYNYIVTKEGYQDLSGSITVGNTAYDMGTLILPEIAFPPANVVATENVAQTQVTVTWNTPVPEPPIDDFENDNGDWVPTATWDPVGDWEWTNTYDIANWAPTYTGTNVIPPPNCHSGTGMWGTKINTNYNNSGGDNLLTKTFNLAGTNDAELRFWSWENVFGNFDYCQVMVNGTIAWGPSWQYTNTVWTERVVDLSAYDGQSNVQIQFLMHATTVVNYAGWYIDDVYVGSAQTRAVTSAPSITPKYLTGLDELQASIAAEEYAIAHPVAREPQRTNDRILTGYKVWRLLAANEGNETLWTLLTPTTVTDTTFVDTAWAPLPSGVYEFAVKAVYSNDVVSAAAFSNEIHKGMMGTLTGTVTEFGTNVPLEGATITAGDYSGTSNAQGVYAFLAYQGTYDVVCAKPGYQSSTVTGVNIVGTQTTTQNFILTEITLPPGGVVATEASSELVNITWMAPGTAGGEWIHYDSGINDDSIGTGAAADFDVAIRYPGSALTDYIGMSLYAVKAWPAQAGTFSIRVWTGGTPDAPAQMVVDQPFTPAPLDSYNTVILNTPVTISGTEELWFGYRCNVTGGYPAGCDAGPAIDGFGNMMYYQGAWSTLLELAPTLNYNWNIQGYVGYSAPDRAPEITGIVSHSVAPDGPRVSVGTLGSRGYGSSSFTRSAYPEETKDNALWSGNAGLNDRTLNGYKVWRLQQGQESNETTWTLLTPSTITATAWQDDDWGSIPDGTYKWAVKAIYTGDAMSIAAFSNPLTLITQIGTIAGIVRTTTNAPIMGATITCGTVTATTNASGAYSMQVEAGTHSVTASHPNYQSVTQTGVVVVTGQTTTVNFQLPPSTDILVDGFESYENFALVFAPWTCVDVDQSTTYGMTGISWPNAYAAQAYMIFVPSATTPAVTDAEPHGGIKMAACFASTTPPNNDWLITPVLSNPTEISFWAKSYTDEYGLERFKVGVGTDTNPANFTIISGTNYIQAPVDWTEYTYSLTGYTGNVYVGIQCLSNDAFIFFVDDVRVTGGTANDDPGTPVVATELHGNFPNPFNPETTIRYSVKEASPVTIEIYNVKGQLVRTLVSEAKAAGNYNVTWNGRDNNGNAAASGVYFYKMNAGKYSSTKKMIMMK